VVTGVVSATPGLLVAAGVHPFWLMAPAAEPSSTGALAAFGGASSFSPSGRKPMATTCWS
jgi:hypothetical protein